MWQVAHTAAPTSVAPGVTGPCARQTTGALEVIGHPSTPPSHGAPLVIIIVTYLAS